MKGFRGTIVFALIVLIVGVLAVHEFNKGEKEEEVKASRDNIFANLDVADVIEFSRQSPGVSYKLKKEGDRWLMTEPIEDAADSSAVTSLLRELMTYDVEAVEPDGQDIDWAKYGLVEPLAQFQLRLKEGSTHKVVVGQVRSYDQGYYVKRDEEQKLFVGGSGLDSPIGKADKDLRSKSLQLPTGEPVRLGIVSRLPTKASRLSLVKKDGKWEYAGNRKILIQSSGIVDYVAQFRNLTGESILADKKQTLELKKWGLSSPALEVEIDFDGGKHFKVSLSWPKEGSAAMVGSESSGIYALPKSRVESLAKSLNDFRDKAAPFGFDSTRVQALNITKDNGKTLLRFKKSDGHWIDSNSPKSKVNESAIENVINGLRGLRVDEFLQGTKPKISGKSEIRLMDSDGKSVFEIQYGEAAKTTPSKGASYLAKTNVAEDWIMVNRSSLNDLVNKSFMIEEKLVPSEEKKAK